MSLSFDFFIWQVASGVSQDDQAEATSAMAGGATYLRGSNLPEATRLVSGVLGQAGLSCGLLSWPFFLPSLASLYASVQSSHIGGSQPVAPGSLCCISFPWRPSAVFLMTIYMPVSLNLGSLVLTLPLNSNLSVQLPSRPLLRNLRG